MKYTILNLHPQNRVPKKFLLKALGKIKVPQIKGKLELSLVFVDDATIKKMSAKFRGKNHVTDVLTFPSDSKDDPFIGEIIISLDTAHRQAGQRKVLYSHELLLLVIHGLMHLMGYDDEKPQQWLKMRAVEFEHLLKVLHG